MPDIDTLMQEWPPDFEDLLNKVGLPTADIDCTLDQYVEMICAILDIPIYQSKVQALHVLFTLFSEFKNSQVSYMVVIQNCMIVFMLKTNQGINSSVRSTVVQIII